MASYVETGQVRYIFRNFPLFSIHPQAQKAAEAAECAGEQGKYWEMHEALFNSQDQWSGSSNPEQAFATLAEGVGLDGDALSACLEEGRYGQRVENDYQEGLAAGVTGTPAFRLNGAALSGAQPFETFQQQIDYFLAGGQAPTLEVAADSYRSRGDADAPVVVTEFSDYQCPACAGVEGQLVPELIKRYVDTGKVRFVYREFPLAQIHPYAQKASEAAVCAGEQGSYWEMHGKLFAGREEWSGQGQVPVDLFKGYAQELGLDGAAFGQCLDSGEAALVVQGDLMAGEALGVNATPTFFVDDVPLRGGASIELLGQVIDYLAAGGTVPEVVPRGEDWRVAGNRQTARAAMLAFVEYGSADSADHVLNVLPKLREEYIDAGTLIYVLYPWSESMDTPGAKAAIAAECAGQQSKFWEMEEMIFQKQEEWKATGDAEVFATYAESLDLDPSQFAECLASDEARLRTQSGTVVATMIGVPMAPIYLFYNGQALDGSPAFEEFQAIVDSMVNP